MPYPLHFIDDPESLALDYRKARRYHLFNSIFYAVMFALFLPVSVIWLFNPSLLLGNIAFGFSASAFYVFVAYISLKAFCRELLHRKEARNLGVLIDDRDFLNLSLGIERFLQYRNDSNLEALVSKISAAKRRPTVFEQQAMHSHMTDVARLEKIKEDIALADKAWSKVVRSTAK